MATSESSIEWRVIPGMSQYEVSEYGDVRRIARARGAMVGRILKITLHEGGYHKLTLCMNGKRYEYHAHQLVAKAFLGPKPSPNMEVAHWDGNAANNHYTNLRWATRKDNHADKKRHGTAAVLDKHSQAKLNRQEVRDIRYKYIHGSTRKELAVFYHVNVATIRLIVLGKTWQGI